MSILIKGVGMPDSCAACPLRNQELFKDGKYVYGCTLCGGWGTGQTRAYDCPLVEIPTPHGDLIDRDYLLNHSKVLFNDTVINQWTVINAPAVIKKEE